MMFYNIYADEYRDDLSAELMLISGGALLLVFLLAMVVVCRIEDGSAARRDDPGVFLLFRTHGDSARGQYLWG